MGKVTDIDDKDVWIREGERLADLYERDISNAPLHQVMQLFVVYALEDMRLPKFLFLPVLMVAFASQSLRQIRQKRKKR